MTGNCFEIGKYHFCLTGGNVVVWDKSSGCVMTNSEIDFEAKISSIFEDTELQRYVGGKLRDIG